MKKTFLIFLLLWLALTAIEARVIYGSSNPKKVALTFDDGPSLKYTQQVLKILAREKVKATFFVVGKKVDANPHIVEQMARSGHQIGNHTYNHSRLDWLSDQKLLAEIRKTSLRVKNYTGQKVSIFRPPHGRISARRKKLVQKAGYDIVMWSVNADDFYKAKTGLRSSRSIARRVEALVRGGDIILMHDNSQQTVNSLAPIINSLKSRGFKFVTVSGL